MREVYSILGKIQDGVIPMLYQKKKALKHFASKPCLFCGVGRHETILQCLIN